LACSYIHKPQTKLAHQHMNMEC